MAALPLTIFYLLSLVTSCLLNDPFVFNPNGLDDTDFHLLINGDSPATQEWDHTSRILLIGLKSLIV